MPDKNNDQIMVDSYINGLQGQLRNSTHQWRKLWIANGGDHSVVLPPDAMTFDLTDTGVVVNVLPVAVKASKLAPTKKAITGGDS